MKLFAAIVAVCAALAAGHAARAGEPAPPPPLARFDATGYVYVIPHAPDFATGIASADLRWLHVEGRYNYEALHTGSAFLGLTGSWGTGVRLSVTPMAGATFGRLDGFAPALRALVTWWRFDLWSEPELVVPFSGASGTFFYNWSEVGFSPLGSLRVGGVVQRTRPFESPLSFQRGLFAGVGLGPFNLTVYEFNWGWTAPTFVGALGLTL
jgi:hypothetical protein